MAIVALPDLSVSLAYNQFTTARINLLDENGNPANSHNHYMIQWQVLNESDPGRPIKITPSQDYLTCRIEKFQNSQFIGTYPVTLYFNAVTQDYTSYSQVINVIITSNSGPDQGAIEATSFTITFDPPQTIQ